MISLEELLKAPLLPENLPPFEIIKECQKVEESDNEGDSEEDSEDSEEDDEIVEEVFPCECVYDERSSNFDGQACGPTANCINRDLFIECNPEDCPCRERCQNQRFQKRKYSNVKVIETPGKGFGLFTCEDLKPGTLVMEYVGEIVNKEQMGRRAEKYSKQGQRHFYFMTLRPNQIIDATCKGNLSRFLNHSCSPNCETQKWIVGGKIKIGLFTVKSVKAGSELTFDYKFVRFGKEPQKCLCGEPNCTGFIGVSASEDGTVKRNSQMTETVESEEEEIDEFEFFMQKNPKSAELPGQISLIVTKLIQTDDLELIKKLLKILGSSQKYLCKRKFLNLHGLKLLSTLYTEHSKDPELILSILNILKELPLNTRNSIEDSGWFEKLKLIQEGTDNDISVLNLSKELEEKWSNLESKDNKTNPISNGDNREKLDGFNEGKKSSVPVLMNVPTEFSSALQRKRQQWDSQEGESPHSRSELKSPRQSSPESSRSRSPAKQPTVMIPDPMWLSAKAPDGRTYYYHSVTRDTAWDVPMIAKEQNRDTRDNRDNRDGRNNRDYRDNRDKVDYRHNRERNDYRHNRDNVQRGSRDHRDNIYGDSRPRDYKDYKDHREYREHRDHREPRDHREHRENRDHRDQRDSSSHTLSQPNSYSQSQSNSTNSALLEGVGDSSQLSAIIERAKARRAQDETNESNEISAASPSNLSPSPEPFVNGSNSSESKKYYAKLKEEISGVVIRFFSHYRTDLGNDFKELARKYTHKIMEKEMKDTPPPSKSLDSPVLTGKKKQKIKIYLAEVITGRKIKLSSEHESLLKEKQ